MYNTSKIIYITKNWMWLKTAVQNIASRMFWIQRKSFSYNGSNMRSLSSLLRDDYAIDINTYYLLYQYNGDVRQAIQKISNGVARNGIYLEDNQRKTIESNELTDEVYSLFQLPTFLKWKKDLYRNYMLSGELYIIPIKNAFDVVIWFEILDSRMCSKTVDQYWVITRFVVSTNWYSKIYKPNELAYFKREDSVNYSVDWMWVLNGCIYDALSDLEAMKTNYSFYQNSAIPSAMLLLDDNLSPEEYQNAKDQFEAQFRWSTNQHKTMVAWWVKDIKTISLTPRDMEFINQRHLTTEKISAVFWVPKTILWYTENVNYNNGVNQRKEFIEWTLKPLESDFEHILNKLLEMFRPDLFKKIRIKADGEQLEETQERMDWLRKDVQSGIITINEARIERWYEAVDEENADKLLVSRNAVLLEDIALDPVLNLDEV